jgi:hypothetical protein
MNRLPRDPPLRRDIADRLALGDHGQHGLIPLLSHTHLPHLRSVTDQPKQV